MLLFFLSERISSSREWSIAERSRSPRTCFAQLSRCSCTVKKAQLTATGHYICYNNTMVLSDAALLLLLLPTVCKAPEHPSKLSVGFHCRSFLNDEGLPCIFFLFLFCFVSDLFFRSIFREKILKILKILSFLRE